MRAARAAAAVIFSIVFWGTSGRLLPAAISQWNTDASGNFSDAANWDNGIPGPADTATFRRPGADYTVTFSGSVVTDKLLVGGNTVTFRPSSNGGAFAVVDPLTDTSVLSTVIGELAGENAVLNTSLPLLELRSPILGGAPGSSGTINVLGGRLSLSGDGALPPTEVGRFGAGLITVTNGAALFTNHAFQLGTSPTGNGTIAVSGPGSSIGFEGADFIVGKSGVGQMVITDGAQGSGNLYILNGITRIDGPKSIFDGTIRLDGPSGTLSILNGGQVKSFGGDIGFGDAFGFGTDMNGKVNIDGHGSLWTITAASLHVGGSGSGTLELTHGGALDTHEANIGLDSRGPGVVTVDGVGSIWNMSRLIQINATGTLNITNGGQVNSLICSMGGFGSPAGAGVVLVTGAGSKWTINGPLSIRNGLPISSTSPADLVIKEGGTVVTAGGSLSGFGTSFASVLIDGLGSSWSTSGNIDITIGTLTVTNSAQLKAAGLVTIGTRGRLQGNGSVVGNVVNGGILAPVISPSIFTIAGNYTQSLVGKLQIELGEKATSGDYDRLSTTGSAALDGTLQVLLTNGFMPTLGNSFDILDWGSLSGTFASLQLPQLSGNLGWDTSQLYTTGVISVTTVPEPSAASLLALGGLLGAFAVWRRSGRGSVPAAPHPGPLP